MRTSNKRSLFDRITEKKNNMDSANTMSETKSILQQCGIVPNTENNSELIWRHSNKH